MISSQINENGVIGKHVKPERAGRIALGDVTRRINGGELLRVENQENHEEEYEEYDESESEYASDSDGEYDEFDEEEENQNPEINMNKNSENLNDAAHLNGAEINVDPQLDEEVEYNSIGNNQEVDEEVDDDSLSQSHDLKCPPPFVIETSPRIDSELNRIFNKYNKTFLDYEDQDTYEASMVAEYAPEVFNYMHELELRLRPDPHYMDHQHEIKWYMRATLINWLVQVHRKYKLLPETLFLTVNYIDRFLSKRKVSLSRFQLVGSVALFIAAKYEEIACPPLKEIVHVSEYVYTEEEIIRAEKFMIDVLNFDMGWPGPMSFLRRTSKADDYDYETRTLAKYFLEITIMDFRFVDSLPSWLAAGAHFLARTLLNKGEWTEDHVFYSGYTAEQLMPFANHIIDACRIAETHHSAVFEKYQQKCFKRASVFVQNLLQSVE